jgi:hypothetical protein
MSLGMLMMVQASLIHYLLLDLLLHRMAHLRDSQVFRMEHLVPVRLARDEGG